MSENVKNETTKVVVVANLKSPVIGFVLALFLGWLGIDRFYKGGIISIVLGIVKLIGGLVLFLGYWLVAFIFVFADKDTQGIMSVCLVGYVLWYILDLIFVPLGIVFDNRRKLAVAKGAVNGKSKLDIAMAIIVLLLLAGIIVPSFIITKTDAQVATARSDMSSAQKAIVAKIYADNINAKVAKPTDPNYQWGKGKRLKDWGEWIMEVAGLDGSRWYPANNGIYPVYKVGEDNKLCYDKSKMPLLWINTRTGNLHFNPTKLSDNYGKAGGFCEKFRDSYGKDNVDKIVPLELTGDLDF